MSNQLVFDPRTGNLVGEVPTPGEERRPGRRPASPGAGRSEAGRGGNPSPSGSRRRWPGRVRLAVLLLVLGGLVYHQRAILLPGAREWAGVAITLVADWWQAR